MTNKHRDKVNQYYQEVIFKFSKNKLDNSSISMDNQIQLQIVNGMGLVNLGT